MRHLPKHLRPRWRYLAVEIETWPDATLDRRGFQRELWFSAQNLLGDAGSADLDLTVVSFDHGGATGAAVVRTRRGETDRARAVLACLDAVEGAKLGLRVTGVSGTVRACKAKYIGRRPENPDRRNVAFGDAEHTAVVRDGRVDVRTGDAFTGATELDL